jgi:hypothetical protein
MAFLTKNVELQRYGLPTAINDLLRRLFCRFKLAICHRHFRASLGEGDGCGAPITYGRTRRLPPADNQGRSLIKVHILIQFTRFERTPLRHPCS